jgi:hypothetical protein
LSAIVVSMIAEENRRSLGTLLTVAGVLSFLSAIFSLFNRRMTIAGNLLIFAGVYLVLGTVKFAKFLSQPHRVVGSVVFLLGFALILTNRLPMRVIGGILELGGILSLFGGFIPKLMNTLQKIPYVGQYFRFALPAWLYPRTEELPL